MDFVPDLLRLFRSFSLTGCLSHISQISVHRKFKKKIIDNLETQKNMYFNEKFPILYLFTLCKKIGQPTVKGTASSNMRQGDLFEGRSPKISIIR
jgi:hypothetical protein